VISRLSKLFMTFFAVAVLIACSPTTDESAPEVRVVEGTEAQRAFDQFSEDFIEAMLVHSPEWAIYQGRYENADQMTLPTPAQRAANLDFATSWLAQLEAFDPTELSIDQQPDYALLHNRLNSSLWYEQEFRGWQWNPASYNVVRTMAVLLNTEYAPIEDRLRAVMARLSSVPAYYEAAKQNIDRPTLEHIDLAIVQNQGAFSVLNDDLIEQVRSSDLSATEKAQFEQYFAQANAAIRDWIDYLGTLQESWADREDVRSFRIGSELYEQKFAYDIQSQFTAKELYERALLEKESLLTEMDDITIGLWPKYFPDQDLPEDRLIRIQQLIDHLSDQHVALEDFVPEIRRQIPRETPEYMRGTGAIASVSSPGPFNPGADTYYNITPLEHFGPEAAASYLREYNQWILQILNIHEAIPGHYTQLLHANLSPSLVKSLFGNGAMIEGWAVYSERMMLEEGWGDYEPELWLMHGKWLLRVVHNAILDYEVQVLGRGQEEIIAMLRNEAFQEVSEATQKWRRATLSQVQLTSYYAGYAEIYALREQMKQAQGDQFNLRDWHNEFLSHGSAPVSVIAGLMQSAN